MQVRHIVLTALFKGVEAISKIQAGNRGEQEVLHRGGNKKHEKMRFSHNSREKTLQKKQGDFTTNPQRQHAHGDR